MANSLLNSKDTISAALAECYVTIPVADPKTGKLTGRTNRYNFMQAINLEAKIEKNKVEVPILGKPGKGNKTVGWKGTGTATFHYNPSVFRELLSIYKDTGADIYFDIQVINEDKTSAVGKQVVILKDCNLNGGLLAKFDANGDMLDETVDFTFEDFKIPTKFKELSSFKIN